MTHDSDLKAKKKKSSACSGGIETKARRTFSLRSRTVRVAQGEQSHLDELVEEHVLPDQNELSMFLFAVELDGALVVLHHTKHRQHVT